MMQTANELCAYLVLTNGNLGEAWGIHDRQRMVIGRSQQCDITLPKRYSGVSRRHAEIFVDRQGLKIRDLSSRSGTRINGVWIEEHREACLVLGDRIWMGGVELDVVSQLPVVRNAPASAGDLSMDDTVGRREDTLPLPTQLLLAELSQAELAIVLWIGRGYFGDEEIAQKLYRSPNTVRTQINSIFRKLGVHCRADIIGLLKARPSPSPLPGDAPFRSAPGNL